MNEYIVKVRERHGTNSLDITIPAKISLEHDIIAGDLFKITVEDNNEALILSYESIYKTKR